ncbi:hypothetical protein [Aminobacter sp. MDW-2]|uniref:hypothetical protein n=1 Tax=Aminobacter sp. MDW-2 TaxID=2666139 RepID=UPI0012B0AF25|nr:hypothetical protein [Aminobacter sp. MDW-2]MRX32805.1 hypothetical protein [Aminobacter sp. MDW-2]QNH37376.1 hypothetical protein H5P29_00850 [Aminobacter sp. MDW-2]
MVAILLANNATSTLAANIDNAVTAITIQAGDAVRFPSPAGGDWFPLTVVDAGGNMEVMKVTARAGAILTVQRGQEGTTAKAFLAGSRADIRMTAAAVNPALRDATGLRDGLMTAADKAKLDGVSAGAQPQAVTSVNTKTGAVVLAKADVGLGSVDNTSDALKPISNATQAALNNKADAAATTAALNGKQASLGFTPVQQGTGVGQLANAVKIGWKANSKIGVTVDNTDMGHLLTDADIPAPTAGDTYVILNHNGGSAFIKTGTGYNAVVSGIRQSQTTQGSVLVVRAGTIRVRYTQGNWGWCRILKNGTQIYETSSGGGGNSGMVDVAVVPGDVITGQVRGNTGSDTTTMADFRILSGTPAFGAVI